MNRDFWRSVGTALLCVAAFGIVFAIIAWGVTALTDTKFTDAATAVQAIGILVAICVGGVFAYQRLQIFRTFEPHLTITHKVSHRHIGDSYTHIAVTATLRNSSKVQVELRDGFFRLQKITPLPDEEVEALYAQAFNEDGEYVNLQWDTLERIERSWSKNELIVEPGESHPETYEFIVARDVESVLIYTYFYAPRFSQDAPSPRGWVATTVYDIVNHHRSSISE